jgi:serine/threonine protein kinase
MELLEEIDAEALIKRFGPIPAERVVHILRQMCHSLSGAESRGLVHRDIKPAHIFLSRYGEDHDFVKVLDFGIAKAVHQPSFETQPAVAVSTRTCRPSHHPREPRSRFRRPSMRWSCPASPKIENRGHPRRGICSCDSTRSTCRTPGPTHAPGSGGTGICR